MKRIFKALLRDRFGRPTPLHVSWVVTSRCNLRCAYCDRPENDPGELDSTAALKLADDLARAGCVRLSLTGGEPLLRDDLPIIMARARRLGLRMNINTNGLLAPKRMNAIRLADEVVISLDGPEEIHDAVRGLGSFRGAMTGAEAVREARLPLTFYTVIGRRNADRLEDVVEIAEREGARVFFQPGAMARLDGGCGDNEEAAPPEDYRRAVDHIIRWKLRGRPVGNSLPALRYLRKWPDPNPITCMGGRLFLRIDSDGCVRPCGRVPRMTQNTALTDGVVAAMSRIGPPDCSACYSAARVEVNLMAAGSPGAIWRFLRK